MILIINGAFGIGKTTVAREVTRRTPRSVLVDPEIIGIALQRTARLVGRDVPDFQDLRLWRRLTVAALRIARALWPNVIVPMAFSNAEYLMEIRARLQRFEPVVVHVCLVAPVEVAHARLAARGADRVRQSWEYLRATECCAVHSRPEFSRHVHASGSIDDVVEEVLAIVSNLN